MIKVGKGKLDVNELIKFITLKPGETGWKSQRHQELLSINGKMAKTADGTAMFYNIGLPAIQGVVFDLSTKQFYYVVTCPGAGTCKNACFAIHGNYIQYDASWIKETRILNFLINYPQEFEAQLKADIITECLSRKNAGIKIILRWHDAGDFFAKLYMEIAIRITAQLNEEGYDFTSYAYSKMADFINMPKPDNFITSWSEGAAKSQQAKMKDYQGKRAHIIPFSMFNDIFVKERNHFTKDADNQYIFKDPQSPQILKDRIAAKYNIDPATLLYDNELGRVPSNRQFKYNAIVIPGQTDWPAVRKDVQHIFLLQH